MRTCDWVQVLGIGTFVTMEQVTQIMTMCKSMGCFILLGIVSGFCPGVITEAMFYWVCYGDLV